MLNKDILEILNRLRKDCPDFYALEGLSPSMASQIAHWIKEDRIHTTIKTINHYNRKTKKK